MAKRCKETGEDEEKAAATLSEDPVAISAVAMDANVPAEELRDELKEFRLEMKQGMEKLDGRMKQMLQRKSSDRHKLDAVMEAVNAGLEREKELAERVRSVSDGLEKKTKKELVHNQKEAALEQFEIVLDVCGRTLRRRGYNSDGSWAKRGFVSLLRGALAATRPTDDPRRGRGVRPAQ